jgi:dihydrofolate reductase
LEAEFTGEFPSYPKSSLKITVLEYRDCAASVSDLAAQTGADKTKLKTRIGRNNIGQDLNPALMPESWRTGFDDPSTTTNQHKKMATDRKVILYIATSLDGYIAKPNDDLGFLSIVEQEGQDYGYADFVKTVDAVIVGRKTYDKVISMGFDFPHADKDAYVITRTPRPSIGSVKFYTGDLKSLVNKLKSENGKNIFCDGGAEIVNELLKDDLIDEFIISVIPILVGNGTKLFRDGRPEQKLELISTKQFEKGLTQLHYKRADK